MSSGRRVRLGQSELQVSPVCYGTWQLSPRFWGAQPEEQITAAIRHAYEHDINFYDTADAYGDGYAETVLGKAIAELPRDQIVIATKLYHHFYPDGSRHGDLSPAYVRQACDNSLKRLGVDHIDLYQCHAYDALTAPADVAGAMDELVQAGKVRAYGVSNWTVEQLRAGHAAGGRFATAQPPYSLLRREIEDDILPYCLANDVGTLVYSSLHLGLLTGKYKGDETFTDTRSTRPDFAGDRFKLICGRVAEVGQIARKYDLTTVQLVLAVTLMHPGITSAIVGIKTPQQIEEAAGAMGKTVSHADAHHVRALLNVK